jgi:Cu-Zn family superoxide dismutase
MNKRSVLKLAIGVPALLAGLAWAEAALAERAVVTMHEITPEGTGKQLGTITLTDTDAGLQLAFQLKGLPPGEHGIHVHEKGSCDAASKDGEMQAGLGAGAHYDPAHSGHHLGPNGQGHLGDLELISVDASGIDTEITTAKRLHLSDIRGRAIIIHAGGDNYADQPKPLGGGGARIACGIIK